MEKEHKSKNKSKVRLPSTTNPDDNKKQEISIEPKKSLESEKVHEEHASEIKLGTFPKHSKRERTKIDLPFYLFAGIILVLAFAVGGFSARFIPGQSTNFPGDIWNRKSEETVPDPVSESTSSSTESQSTSNQNTPMVLKTQPPEVSAKAYGVFKLNNGEYELITNKMPELQLPMASVTKIMTAVVAMEQYDLDKPIVVPEKCVALNGSSIGLRANDVLSLQDMLYGLLVKSGADAACAISNIDNERDFTALMNKRAAELGMTNTKFTNVIGFDNGDSHVSNVDDLKVLVSHALKFSTFRKIVGTEEFVLTSKSSGANYRIRNTNDLLFSIPGTVGIKTGYTDSAGECLAYLYQNKNEEILIIILGSYDRFGDTSKLLEWAKTEITMADKTVSDVSGISQANN